MSGGSDSKRDGATGQHAPLAIVFADVSGSTRLYETLGDTMAHRILGRLLEDLSRDITAAGGRIVKTIGDELMATFEDAPDAVQASCAMQRRFAQAVRSPEGPTGIHIGMHYGPVLESSGDVFGDTVNVAARVVALAKPGQILTTAEGIERLPQKTRSETRRVDLERVRGKEDEVEVFEVLWQPESATAFIEIPRVDPAGPAQLRLRHRELEVLVSHDRPSLSIGRDETNDVVLPFGMVSRRHARIEYRRGRFVLIDESTNGTLVVPEGMPARFVRRDEVFLEGSGVIAPGFEPDTHPSEVLHFDLRADG